MSDLRTAFWQSMIDRHGRGSKPFRRARISCFTIGPVLIIGGIFGFCVLLFKIDIGVDWESVTLSIGQRVGRGLILMLTMTPVGLLLVYLGLWPDEDTDAHSN